MTMRNPYPLLFMVILASQALYVQAALLSNGDPEWAAELRTPSQAIKDAARDIASGHIKIYYFNGGAVPGMSPVGILDDQQHLIEAYAKEIFGPGGCVIGGEDMRMLEYAEAYNAEILKHILAK